MADTTKIERRWLWMLNHEHPDVRMIAGRLGREPVLRRLFPYTTDETLFRFSTVTDWPFDTLPHLGFDRDDGGYWVEAADGRLIASGTLEEVVPALVREVTAHLAAKRSAGSDT